MTHGGSSPGVPVIAGPARARVEAGSESQPHVDVLGLVLEQLGNR
jgi:hypothetical protein